MNRSAALEAPESVKLSVERLAADPPPSRSPDRSTVRWCEVELDDAQLVRRALADDAWARAALYHRHARDIARLALRLLRRQDEAEDVVQDTFVTAFESLRDLREPDRARAWLRMIAVRHVQRRFRRRRLLRLLGLGSPPAAVSLDELALSNADQETRVQLRRVDRVLAAMPERARLVWTLRLVEGESLPDIAASCGISIATVKRDLALAQSEVRRALDGVEP